MPDSLTVADVGRCVGVSTGELERWIGLGLLAPDDGGRLSLDDLGRARLLVSGDPAGR